jgi:hypothetical protein
MQSLTPFENDPAIYSVGGFTAISKDGREYCFDWNEGESWVSHDDQERLVIETQSKFFANDLYDESNLEAGINPEELTPEFITSSKLTEVFYECFPTLDDELTGVYLPMEPIEFKLIEYDAKTEKSNEAEFPIKELQRYQKENAYFKPDNPQ